MDAFNEKKWFVYVGDHHEGPFSLSEIQGKMAGGTVDKSQFVWCEGMSDWKAMTDVPEFAPIMNPTQHEDIPPIAVPETVKNERETRVESESSTREEPEVQTFSGIILTERDERTGTDIRSYEDKIASGAETHEAVAHHEAEGAQQGTHDPHTQTGAGFIESKPKAAPKVRGRVLFYTLLPAVIIGLYISGMMDSFLETPGGKMMTATVGNTLRPLILKILDKSPSLVTYLSPLPEMEGVGADDVEDLKQTAIRKMTDPGKRLAVGLDTRDKATPEFYVAGNLPDGTKVDLVIEGVPETLLNQTSYFAKSTLEIKDRWGKTPPMRGTEGHALPRGHFNVYVFESDNQNPTIASKIATLPNSTEKISDAVPKDRKLTSKKVFFLGGKRDPIYIARLKEFHESLRKRAQQEVTDLTALNNQLENQLTQTLGEFNKFKRAKGKAQQKGWNVFHDKWNKIQMEITKSTIQWTPDFVREKFFYYMIYEALNRVGESVSRVHDIQNQFFSGKVDTATADIKVGESASQARTFLDEVKVKLQKATQLSSSQFGLPKREGI